MAGSTPNPRILITGASGAYGQLLFKRLLEKGIDPSTIILVSRNPNKLSETSPPIPSQVTLRKGSFDDPLSDLTATFTTADIIFLISTSRAGARLPQHQNAITAAVRSGAQHIFYTGFIGADLPHPSALVVREHRATEEMLRLSGISAYTVLRDTQYSDAFADVILPAARHSGCLKTNCGKGKIAPVAKEDCVEVAAVAVMNADLHRNRVYDVTGPELLSYGEVVEMAAKLSGQDLPCEFVSDEEMFEDFDRLGIPREPGDEFEREGVKGYKWNSSDMVSFGTAIRLGEMAVISDDVEKIIGRKPIGLLDVLKSRVDGVST